MLATSLRIDPGDALVVALLGAHCDDIEIGAGGLLLSLAARYRLTVVATIVTSTPEREAESRAALAAFAPDAAIDLEIHGLRDGRLPASWHDVKEIVEQTRQRAQGHVGAQLVVGPCRHDAHQDHRLLAELIPTAFRDHLVAGYEILKYDGDLGRPNVYVPLTADVANRKVDLLFEHYGSQHGKTWFDREAFLGLMRVRGVECNNHYAEGFVVTKAVLAP